MRTCRGVDLGGEFCTSDQEKDSEVPKTAQTRRGFQNYLLTLVDHAIACQPLSRSEVITYHMAERVLVAIDDSGPATAALEYALARFSASDITFFM